MEQLENLSIADLRILAREKGLKNVTSYRKAELVSLLAETIARENPQPAENRESGKDRPAHGRTASARQGNARAEQPAADKQRQTARVSKPEPVQVQRENSRPPQERTPRQEEPVPSQTLRETEQPEASQRERVRDARRTVCFTGPACPRGTAAAASAGPAL